MKTISFYGKRRIFFLISGVIFLIGIVFVFINGVNLDIQFKGGSIIKYSYNGGAVDTARVASVASGAVGSSALPNVQITEDVATGNKTIVINLAGNSAITAQQQATLDTAMKEAFPELAIASSTASVVDPFIGARFIQNCLIAIGLGFILIVFYVWYAFRKIGGLSAGVMGIVALLHDVVVVFSVFVIFNIPINESFIVVALTIIGYSINDTIVIYDRIRENKALYGDKLPLSELVDRSISQSFARAINTSLVVFVVLAVILVLTEAYGVTSMRSFTLPMLIGNISGCYSSLCIAGPLWVMWKNRKEKKSAKAK